MRAQGSPKAVATLLNHKLQPKGITAKTFVINSCLRIILEAAKTPLQQPLVDFIRKEIINLNTDAWQIVKVWGRQLGKEIPDWVEELKVSAEPTQSLEVLARQGDVKAIATLINQNLRGANAKVSLKGDCLQVMLEAAQVPEQKAMVSLIKTEILKLEIQPVTAMKLYGKQADEDFPDWYEEVSLISSTDIRSTEVQLSSLSSDSTTQGFSNTTMPLVAKEIDSIGLSNQIYIALKTICYEHLAHKLNSEDDKTIHEIVEHFIDGLESELKLDLEQFPKQVVSVAKPFGVQLDSGKTQSLVSDLATYNFAGVRLAIRELEKVTREVLQIDFPKETNGLKAFFTGAAQEFTANLFGKTTMSTEAIVGATIGTIVAPGIGSVIGGAIGGWLGGNKQEKAIQAVVEKYQKARAKLFQEW